MERTRTKAMHVLRWLWHVVGRVAAGELTVAGGGIALFGLLATIPAVAAVVSIYALAADPGDIPTHLGPLRHLVPAAVHGFIVEQLWRASQRTEELSFTLVTSLLLSTYSARNAIGALLEGLARAYRRPSERTWVQQFVLSLVAAVGVMVALLVSVLVLVALPTLGTLLRVDDRAVALLESLRWPVLLVIVISGLLLIYRAAGNPHGRPRRAGPRARIVPGAVLATLAWLVVSYGLELWVDRVADYQVLYGAFASVVVLILWFYLSAMCVLVGAVVNAELDDLLARLRAP